jgi:hypothetical protein
MERGTDHGEEIAERLLADGPDRHEGDHVSSQDAPGRGIDATFIPPR